MTLTSIPFVEYYLRQNVSATDVVLDLGCGPDRYRSALAPARYIGMDITAKPYHPAMPRMVELVASADRIPLADSTIDVAFSVSAFFLFPNIDKTLNEILRVLRSRGRLFLFDYNRRTQRRLGKTEGKSYPCWTQRELKKLLDCSGYADSEILTPRIARPVSRIEHKARELAEELFGTWAVVSARAP